MNTINVPERNRAIKRLLIRTYGKQAGISVRAGSGTAYHWVEIVMTDAPASLRIAYGQACDALCALIRANGIDISTFASDGDYTGDCLTLTLKGAR
jgi:hypothetical protein